MKKVFSGIFMTVGGLNLLIGFIGLFSLDKTTALIRVMCGLLALVLGAWMSNSEKAEEEYKPYEFKSKLIKKKKPKIKNSKEYKILVKAKNKDLITEDEFDNKVKKLKQKAT